jgi:hypothetical protein
MKDERCPTSRVWWRVRHETTDEGFYIVSRAIGSVFDPPLYTSSDWVDFSGPFSTRELAEEHIGRLCNDSPDIIAWGGRLLFE